MTICSNKFYRKNLYKTYNSTSVQGNEEIKGDIILLSGFGKHGTYELSRMLSKINKPNRRTDEDKSNKNEVAFFIENEYIKKESSSTEELFRVINETKKNDNYCIEAIFDFIQECRENKDEKCKKCCWFTKKQEIILKRMMFIDVNDKEEIEERDDLLKKLVPHQFSEPPSPAADSSTSEVKGT